MTAPSLLDAFDTVSRSELMTERLESALAELERRPALKDERAWLTTAVERVAAARAGVEPVLNKAMRLPELAPLREDHAYAKQQAAVDALERLQAGIAFHAGPRAPLLEALFGKLKLPALRRADRKDFEKLCAEFEKRLQSGYAKRMLADPGLEPLSAAVEQLRAAVAEWREAYSGEPLPEAEAKELQARLIGFAEALELPLRQARLLAEAALAPVDGLFEESGLGQKPRRRARAQTAEPGSVESPE